MELYIAGAAIFAYLVIVIACMVGAFRWAGRRGLKWRGKAMVLAVVMLVAWAIPFGDHTIGLIYFRWLCEKEAGTKIYRVVPEVEGLWWWPISSERMALDYGFVFVEGGVNPEKVTRYEVRDREIVQHRDVKSISRYALHPPRTEDLQLWIVKQQDVIEDIQTKEQLAVRTSFVYRGGWLIRAVLAGYSGIAASCPQTSRDSERFLLAVLKPIHGRK